METLNALELLTAHECELLFYHRHRRALLTVARFSGLPLSVVNAGNCWCGFI
jgi:hypothetical protein